MTKRVRFQGLWRHQDFRRLWAAQTVSLFGSLISRAAMSFTAILVLKATPAQLSLLVVADLLPQALAGQIAGVWVDRLRRRALMVGADIGRAVLLATIPLAAALHLLKIEHLYVVTFLAGLLTVLFDIANRAYLPTLIESEALVEGNSKLTASASVAEFGAFSLAGWLVQWLSGPFAVLIDAISFAFSALFLGRIRAPEPAAIPHEEREPFVRELREGWQAVRDSATLRALTLCAMLLGLFSGIIRTLIVAYMTRGLGLAPGLLGMIWALGGVAALGGAVWAGPLARRFGTGPALIGGLAMTGVGMLLVPLAQGATALSVLLLVANQVLTDSFYVVYEINAVSLRQALTPERLLGRVTAALETLGLLTTLLGALLAGWLAARLGLRLTLAIGASGSFLAALVLALSPVRQAGQRAAEVPSTS